MSQPKAYHFMLTAECVEIRSVMHVKVCRRIGLGLIFQLLVHTVLLGLLAADFGLSKIIGPEVQMQTVCGTPGYCGESMQNNMT